MNDYMGEVRLFGGNFAPRNWALCNGQLLNINDNTALFSILGTTFGGDGRTTFALPDLKGRCPVSAGQTVHQGVKSGFENAYLVEGQIPTHTHAATPELGGRLRCNNNLTDHTSPMGNTLGTFKDNVDVYNANQPDADMHDNTVSLEGSIAVAPAGGSTQHNNMQPSLALNYIICVNGLYPQRS